MRQIRRDVFETNSSSSHSISIRKINDYYTQQEIEDSFYWKDKFSTVCFWPDDLYFGRSPFEVLTSFRRKIEFAIASLVTDDDSLYLSEIEALLFEKLPGLATIKFKKDFTTKKNIYGDVDWQSDGLLEHFLNTNNISLREFLLSKKYIVFIDGDEYCVKENLIENGLLHKDDFERL